MTTIPGPRAVIYLDDDSNVGAARAACLAHCEQRGYQVIALVMGNKDGQAWRDGVVAMLFSGDAEVVVLQSRTALPPRREPRVEFVEDRQADQSTPGRHRRRPRPKLFDR